MKIENEKEAEDLMNMLMACVNKYDYVNDSSYLVAKTIREKYPDVAKRFEWVYAQLKERTDI